MMPVRLEPATPWSRIKCLVQEFDNVPTVGYEPAVYFLFHGFLVYVILSVELNSNQ